MKEVKINIQDSADREKAVVALANAGYSVRIAIEEINTLSTKYWVAFCVTDYDIEDTK